ncbi:TPA: hypothetical protein ACNSTW_003880 [Acinetobacter baumannii]|uniref:hypothetical protein n=2 Tax=Acinetobacter baumannii TaxID=470 RepID=UPI00069F8A77|nr:hypothetical protein [Acinetobacter baumannii]AVI33337.1 hypothetical protein CSB70_2830 [Acinetobacter baumannii]AVI37164.1 hypothetical protein CSB68_0417 [Acinetobacter baumannii]MCG5960740.1 hypothetical protein [Acinetobacter baumannii]MCJ8529739.1 hypothetical protein [Acinetobacter baumannii]MCY2898544.1 hypothetical protein [Acinetobacter baumannii]
MTKKSLNEKFKVIGFWIFAGIFWYLVIAFFLKSKYPIFNFSFNLDTAYDVLKDALTLAAAFLAPVAAFVLFSNWREQHIEVEIEKGGIELYERLMLIRNEISDIQSEICFNFSENKKGLEDRLTISLWEKIFQVNLIKNRLRKRNKSTITFCSFADQIGRDIEICSACLINMYSAKIKINNPDIYNFEYINESDKEFKERYQEKFDEFEGQYIDGFNKLTKDLEDLDILTDTIRIQI